MITTLTGQNGFELQKALQMLSKTFTSKHGDLGLERLDGDEVGLERIREALTSLPFLAAKKMVVLRAPSANKQFIDQAEQLLGDVPETTDVVLVEPKLDRRTAYYKFLKKQTDFKEFPEVDPQGLAKWLVNEAKAKQGSLTFGDASYLVERVGANQQLVAGELEKLLLYSSKVDRATIDLLTDPAPQSTIFELLDAAFAGNHKKAMRLYDEQRTQKVEPIQIVAMLAWQLHVLALIKTAGDRSIDQIAKEAKINPFVIRKSQSIAHRLSVTDLKALVSRLLEIDVATKRTSIDADDALQHYLLKLGH